MEDRTENIIKVDTEKEAIEERFDTLITKMEEEINRLEMHIQFLLDPDVIEDDKQFIAKCMETDPEQVAFINEIEHYVNSRYNVAYELMHQRSHLEMEVMMAKLDKKEALRDEQ